MSTNSFKLVTSTLTRLTAGPYLRVQQSTAKLIVRCGLLYLVAWLVSATPALCAPQQNFSIDIGFGLPQLYTANANFQVWKRWQFGMGYGFLPPFGQLASGRDLPPMFQVAPNGTSLWIYPKAKGSISWFNPYARFFPGHDNFYFQFSYFYYSASLAITSKIEDGNSQVITNDGVSGTVTIRQFIPTLSIGCIFGNQLYFFNMNMGYSFVGATSTSVSLTGSLGQLGALAPDALKTVEDGMAQAVNNISDVPKSIVANWPFPSIYLSFGVFF